eukprot:560443-Amphidinium_carterae.1
MVVNKQSFLTPSAKEAALHTDKEKYNKMSKASEKACSFDLFPGLFRLWYFCRACWASHASRCPELVVPTMQGGRISTHVLRFR